MSVILTIPRESKRAALLLPRSQCHQHLTTKQAKQRSRCSAKAKKAFEMEHHSTQQQESQAANQIRTGCIDTAPDGKDHILQLHITPCENGWRYIVYSLYAPGGKPTRRGVIDEGDGKTYTDYEALIARAQEAFQALKAGIAERSETE